MLYSNILATIGNTPIVKLNKIGRKNGSMAELLKANNVSWAEAENRDPYSFLPGWLHAR